MPMIDLGKPMGEPCCGPEKMPEKGEKYYPTIYINDVEELDLPEEGEALVKFKMVRDTKDMKTGKHEVVLEIREIGNYGDPAPERKKDRGRELDAILREVLKERDEED